MLTTLDLRHIEMAQLLSELVLTNRVDRVGNTAVTRSRSGTTPSSMLAVVRYVDERGLNEEIPQGRIK